MTWRLVSLLTKQPVDILNVHFSDCRFTSWKGGILLWKQHIVKTQQLKMFSKQIHFDHFLISDQGGYTMPERSCKKRVPLNFFIQNFVEWKSTHGKSDETVRYCFGDLSSITALSTNPSLSLSLAATKPPSLSFSSPTSSRIVPPPPPPTRPHSNNPVLPSQVSGFSTITRIDQVLAGIKDRLNL